MKIKLLIAILVVSYSTIAQTSVPNGNFENWNSVSFDVPQYYPNTSNNEVYRVNLPFNCLKTTDKYHGQYALKLTTVDNATDTLFGYIVNGNPEQEPDAWHGGIAYTQKPTAIRGYYKSGIVTGDTGFIVLAFSKAGMNIGTFGFPFYGTHSSYTLFTLPINLIQTPDSFMFAAVSGNALGKGSLPGSWLQLDSISFVGVNSQPAELNGDFELWSTKIIENPSGWYIDNDRGEGVKKISGAYRGSYAVELTTFQGDNDGVPSARGSALSTGYYERNCKNCDQKGGYPFSRTSDTLAFWYKYTPAGNSLAEASVRLKYLGNNVWGNYVSLAASASYKYVEIPITPFQPHDTLIVDFRSSRWQDSLVTQVGSILIVDEVHLKSSPLTTGVNTISQYWGIKVYPNPVNGLLHIRMDNVLPSQLFISDVSGKIVMQSHLGQILNEIETSSLRGGLYFFRIEYEGILLQSGKLLIE